MLYSKHRFHVLDGMRGVAAITVMIYHYCYNLHLMFLKNAFLAVDFFFILSGFVILFAYQEKLLKGMKDSDFISRRVGRLYPLYLVGLIIGLPALFLKIIVSTGNYGFGEFIANFLTNLIMLPYITDTGLIINGVHTPIQIFASDNPLWTIFSEMIASFLFLFLFRLNYRSLLNLSITFYVILCITALMHGLIDKINLFDENLGFDPSNILGGFPRLIFSFSIGMIIYRWRFSVPEKSLLKNRKINPWIIYLSLLAMLTYPTYAKGLYDLFAVAIIAPLLVWYGSLSICEDKYTKVISEFLGWISFPLYCLHYPIYDLMRTLKMQIHISDNLIMKPAVLAIPCTVFASILIGMLIDKLKIQSLTTKLAEKIFSSFLVREV